VPILSLLNPFWGIQCHEEIHSEALVGKDLKSPVNSQLLLTATPENVLLESQESSGQNTNIN
jgi:hypothetical protein